MGKEEINDLVEKAKKEEEDKDKKKWIQIDLIIIFNLNIYYYLTLRNKTMAENALYEALETYNNTIDNKYKQNWGSLMDFLGKLHLFYT